MRVLPVILAALLLSGCYYAQAVRGHLALMSGSEPIEDLLEQGLEQGGDDALHARLERALEIREFASVALGLPDNDSYRNYADLGRDYATWLVVATDEFSVEPETWCFPFAGCLAYRGYFNEADARRFADKLAARGMDVSVSGTVAYSTLGHFADPLLNTMLERDEAFLAATVFHELAHQQLYVPGDSAYNEAFAVVVEREGVRRWFEHRGDPSALQAYTEHQASQREITGLLAQARADLEALYRRDLPVAEMRARKAERFARLQAEHAALRGQDLNNARLALVATYNELVPALERLLADLDHDLQRFYTLAGKLGGESYERRRELLARARAGEFELSYLDR